ncbi:hypothetical protein BCR32DRAFT_244085 [Anaeromyces robustus]|uniref:Uncharacterized protein n=1 Tax=Anaeromyces robustus TaxID=1754192 RepID=A0A1Y1XA09_9FUNG|nr:hypothetical protein BCR32DRAFT_244085 [Anaeromyces robustus]|eukprot:ORX82570.1 hypothetical protein BCR32DRAFT_244085 [Anaeromyces robustus]
MATVRISMPDEEFIELKEIATYIEKLKFEYNMPIMSGILKRCTENLQIINFKEIFPGYNFTKILPELKIDENGYAKFDIEQVVNNFDYNIKHYNEGSPKLFIKHILNSNKSFKLLEISDTLKEMKMADTDNKDEILSLINVFEYITNLSEFKYRDYFYFVQFVLLDIKETLKLIKKINFNELFPENDYNKLYPELQIDKDGFPKFNIDEVFAGFKSDIDYLREICPDLKDVKNFIDIISSSNENFNFTEIKNIIERVDKSKEMLNDMMNTGLMTSMMNNVSQGGELNHTEEIQDYYDYGLTEFKTKNATMTFELNK